MDAMHTMGWRVVITKHEKACIALTACTLVFYSLGYKKVVGITQVNDWIQAFENIARFTRTMFVLKCISRINELCRQNNKGASYLPA
jgi:hypothetical protein